MALQFRMTQMIAHRLSRGIAGGGRDVNPVSAPIFQWCMPLSFTYSPTTYFPKLSPGPAVQNIEERLKFNHQNVTYGSRVWCGIAKGGFLALTICPTNNC